MKKNIKYILTFALGIGLMLIAESCGDSLGIEDNYSKKLLSGKEIKDLSYKEYVKITRDTLVFYSDTIVRVDTVHYPVYDTVRNSKTYPTNGFIFENYAILQSKIVQIIEYPVLSVNSDIIVNYINNNPILNINADIEFKITTDDPLYYRTKDLPKSLSLKLKGITLYTKYNYLLTGDETSGAFGSIDVLTDEGNRLTYQGQNSGLSFYIDSFITAPDDPKKVLFVKGIVTYISPSSGYVFYSVLNMLLY